jgi:fibronectin type 3 domain-containing protein
MNRHLLLQQQHILFAVFIALFVYDLPAQKAVSAIEGNEGIWIYFSKEIIGSGNKEGIRSATVLRAESGNNFREIGTAKAISNTREANELYGQNIVNKLRLALKANSDDEVFSFLNKNTSLDEYGLLPLDPYFMQSMGAAFLDKQKPASGSNVKYRVQLKREDGSLVREGEDEIIVGVRPRFNRISVIDIKESDSLISIRWRAKQDEQNPFYFANVYRQTGKTGTFSKAGTVMGSWQNDSVAFVWSEQTTPGSMYRYFLLPTNLVGFEGNPSDTALCIAANFHHTPIIENLSVTDTTGGILFSWTPLKENPLFSGLAVYRKPLHIDEYVPIDTIPFTASEYVDVKVIANVLYQYQLRAVNIRFNTLPPSAQATAIHRNNLENNLPPVALAAIPENNGIRVLWQAVKHYDVNGYYVYRSVNGENYKLQSMLVKDTFFFDEGATNGRSLYNYRITALNFNDDQSEPSNTVQAQPKNTIPPISPLGISAYSESGKINLSWNDMRQQDEYVIGYNVYRKEGIQNFDRFFSAAELLAANFFKLNPNPVRENYYADKTAENGKTYTYAITSVEVSGLESNAAQLIEVETPKPRLAAPSFFNLAKTDSGIRLSWSEETNTSITKYVIFRRQRNATALLPVGTADARELSFTDNTAVPGTFYFYAIKARNASGAESDFSIEKGITR